MRIFIQFSFSCFVFFVVVIFGATALATPPSDKHPLDAGNVHEHQSLDDAIQADGFNAQDVLRAEALSKENYNKTRGYQRKSEFLEILPAHLRELEGGCADIRCMKGLLTTIGESKNLDDFQPYSNQILEWVWATQDHSWADEYVLNQLMREADSPVAPLLLEIKRSALGFLENEKLRVADIANLSKSNAPNSLRQACLETHSIQDTLAYIFDSLYKSVPICRQIGATKKPEAVIERKWFENGSLRFNMKELLDIALQRYQKLDKSSQQSHALRQLYRWQSKANEDELMREIDNTINIAKRLAKTYRAWFYLRPELSIDVANIEQDSIALQFVRYYKKGAFDIGSNEYLVFVIKKRGRNIQSSIHKVSSQFAIVQANKDFRNTLLTHQSTKQLVQSSKTLFDVIMKPVWQEVKNAKKLFIAGLDNIPFHLMYQNKKSQPLLVSKNISYFNVWDGVSARFLIGAGARQKLKPSKLALFGNPKFGKYFAGAANDTFTSLRSGNEGFPVPFEPLKYTEQEIKEIASLSGKSAVEIFSEQNASEINFYQLNKTKILHIASHAYFLQDSAGIALSNANLSVDNTDNRIGLDGIATDREIAVQDLRGTELAVLSACETGLGSQNSGDIFYGDNISGLASAFHNAGVEKIVMSHWTVDDESTAKFMSAFYQHYLTHSDAAIALQSAQKMLMQQFRDTAKESAYYWGAFTLREQPFVSDKVDANTAKLVKLARFGELESKFMTNRADQIAERRYFAEAIPSYTGGNTQAAPSDKNLWQHGIKQNLVESGGQSPEESSYDPCTDNKHQNELKKLQESYKIELAKLDLGEQIKYMQSHNLKLAELTQKIAMQTAACHQ